jgi:IclR family KDG regulon transcriptional repressor
MNYTVEAVEKALGLLFLVAQQPGLGVTELAKRSGNTKARAFRLLNTLEQSGLVQRQGESTTFSLGYKAVTLGASAQEQLSLVRLAENYLPNIGMRCNENVFVRVRDGLETVCVARWEAPHAVRVYTVIGNRRPLYVGASGKLLLAFASPEIQEAVLSSDLKRLTANTIVDRNKLEAELVQIRQNGYSASFGEADTDAAAVAAPVRNANGYVVATLSIAAPANRMNHENLSKFIELAQIGAHEFSIELGHTK